MIHLITGPGSVPAAFAAAESGDILVCLDQAIVALPPRPWTHPVYLLDTDASCPEGLPEGVTVLTMGTFVHVVAEYGPTRTWSDRA